MNTLEDAIIKVTLFWSDKSFRTALNQNNGDESPQGSMSFMLMNMVSDKAQKSITDDKIKIFEKELAKEITGYRDKYPDSAVWMDVDYHPAAILANPAAQAEIDPGCFPCKTWVRINRDNSVEASYQYGGDVIEL